MTAKELIENRKPIVDSFKPLSSQMSGKNTAIFYHEQLKTNVIAINDVMITFLFLSLIKSTLPFS